MRLGYRDLVIALFAFGIILGLAFGTGTIYGRNSAPTPTPAIGGGGGGGGAAGGGAAGGGAGGAAAAGGGGGGGAGGGPFAGQVLGTITAVQGTTFTLRQTNGTTTTMAEGLSTTYSTTTPTNASSLQPGELVLVNPGPPNSEGQTLATSVFILPASLAGGAPGAGPSGAPGGARPGASATPAR